MHNKKQPIIIIALYINYPTSIQISSFIKSNPYKHNTSTTVVNILSV